MNGINLRQRLLFFSLLPSALIAIVLVGYFTISGMQAQEDEMRERGLAIVRFLAPVSEYGVISGQLENLQGLVQTTVQQPHVKAAIIVNRAGRTMAVSGRISLSSDDLRTAPEAPRAVVDHPQWLAFAAPIQRSIADSDLLFDTAAPKGEPETIGQVFVELDKTELLENRQRAMMRGLFIVAVGLLLVALLAISMADNLTRPVARLVRVVRDMTQGNLDARVPADSFVEFGELEHGFNEMAVTIADAHRNMQQRIEEATAELAFQARHDALTGLINRREFQARLERAMSLAKAGAGDSCVLFIDLDRFKPVNDSCGHLAGDELLRQIARLFQGRLREDDTLARLGGDEFSVLLANCPLDRGQQVASDLCNLATAYRFIWQDKIFSIGASIGLVPVTAIAHSIEEILGAGDSACYQAKEKGRGRVEVLEPGIPRNRRLKDHHPWRERISQALADDSLLFDALPLKRLGFAGEMEHFVEIHTRLGDRNQVSTPMSVLIDAAERYDLAAALEQKVLVVAIKALARAEIARRPLRCLLPLSSTSVRDGHIIESIGNALREEGIDGQGLYLLIPEETAIQHTTQTLELCRAARLLGCRIALGDFGGGFSSFSHLRAIGPNCIKISQSLTRNFSDNRSSLALIRAICEIADDLGTDTIAEGIDDLQASRQLADIGITWGQGKALAPSEPFDAWVEGAVIRASVS